MIVGFSYELIAEVQPDNYGYDDRDSIGLLSFNIGISF